jgi:hypothetical protein
VSHENDNALMPDFMILTPGAMPGATTASVLALMVMHVAVAAIAVSAYQRFMPAPPATKPH